MKRLECLLINPGNQSSVYQGLAHQFSAIEPPSLAAIFATYILRKGRSCEILDAHALDLVPDSVAALVDDTYNPLLVVLVVYGFQPSASTQNMPAAGAIARAIKERRPDIRIMITGTHPSALPERTLNEEAVDIVCSGEGPHAIEVALEYIALREEPPAIIRGDNVRMLDIDMPGAAWNLLPMNQYRAHNWHCFGDLGGREPYASIHTTLGCPYACTFCCINAPFGGPGQRRWSPAAVGAEIETLVHDYGVRNIKFVDEMFVLHKGHVLGVCEEITRRVGDVLNIWAYARIDTVKDELLEPMRKAGIRWLALGIESGSKHVRDGAEKGRFGNDAILKTVKQIQAAGISVIGNYIFGLPDDTQESMEETLSLAIVANCEFANFYSAMAYPGSQLYGIAKEKGWALPDDPGGPGWIGYSQHAYETLPLPTEKLTAAEVLGFRDRAFKRYFTAPSYLSMLERKFGYEARAHVVLMTQQDLKRKIMS